MSDRRDDPASREAYLRGVEALLEGRLDDAHGDLEIAADAGIPQAALALAKLHLERADGPRARDLLAPLLEETPSDPGERAYLQLLSASAAAFDDRPEEALRLLDEIPELDPRLEPAARGLRRRLENRRPPSVRF